MRCQLKKIAFAIVACCLLSSCNGKGNEPTHETESELVISEGVFREIVSVWEVGIMRWDDIRVNDIAFEMDEETALEIGDIILTKILGEEWINNSTFIVSYAVFEEVFIVTRMPSELVPGGDFSVAINKEDGRILKIWGGE